MKESIAEKIKATPLIGIINFNQTKRFYDDNFSTKENMFQFSLSKILIFIGEKNKILGIRSFYKNLKKEEKEGQIGYNDALKVINIIKFEIPSNDHLCCLYIFTSDKGIEQLKFLTKKGKELTVGEGGQNIIKNYINDKENIILSISGGYSDQLDILRFRYIKMSDYFGHTLGYFELRIKIKNEKFKNNINSKIDTYKDSDKILIRACLLPVACFNEIIKFCMK